MGLNNIIGATRLNEGMDLARRAVMALEHIAKDLNSVAGQLDRLNNHTEHRDHR